MKLYLVQDPDRPLYVVADCWQQAIEKWKNVIAEENLISLVEVEEPEGINLICGFEDLVLEGEEERKRRIYYQNIVYEICSILDEFNKNHISKGTGVVCGNVDNPSDELQLEIKSLIRRYLRLRKES